MENYMNKDNLQHVGTEYPSMDKLLSAMHSPLDLPIQLDKVELNFEYSSHTFLSFNVTNGDHYIWRLYENRVTLEKNKTQKVINLEGSKEEKLHKLVQYYLEQSRNVMQIFKLTGYPDKWKSRRSIRTKVFHLLVTKPIAPDCQRNGDLQMFSIVCAIDRAIVKEVTYTLLQDFSSSPMNVPYEPHTEVKFMASMARKENIYKIYLENVTLDFGWSSPSIEECQELIEKHFRRRRVGLPTTILTKNTHRHVEHFCKKDNWKFTPEADILAVTFYPENKQVPGDDSAVVIRFFPCSDKITVTVEPGKSKGLCIQNDVDELRRQNRRIQWRSYQTRQLMRAEHCWEPSIPYDINKMLVDFNNIRLEVDGEPLQIHSSADLVKKVVDLTAHEESRIKLLMIIGHGHLTCDRRNYIIHTKELILVNSEQYPHMFLMNFLGISLKKLEASSRKHIDDVLKYIDSAEKIEWLDKNNKRVKNYA
ncbi:hypothetical protein GCK72_024654 [Caenorhabditis remanei]|uniref:Uncharacterized protein n=1 Tax=Caenorhabditis remanei TaxID=31234 RepID=A0A6A5FZW1_CAERE|nr:hypothetical protein GCK72_024654 [Caenorhabditis remanei]KAF1748187.1 hypothetical protein GCK72_024654 [Caenorhabditis remanei]